MQGPRILARPVPSMPNKTPPVPVVPVPPPSHVNAPFTLPQMVSNRAMLLTRAPPPIVMTKAPVPSTPIVVHASAQDPRYAQLQTPLHQPIQVQPQAQLFGMPAPTVMTVPKAISPPAPVPTPVLVAPAPVALPMPDPVAASAPVSVPTPAQTPAPAPVATAPVTAPIAQVTQGPSQLQVLLQMAMEQIRVRFDVMERKFDARLESTTKEIIGSAIKDLKVQFETSEIVGETLSDNLPVFSRPDPKTTVEHRLGVKGSKIKLLHPVLSNEHGYWMTTTWVTANGSVLTGYAPVFSAKLEGVEYGLSATEIEQRLDSWKGYLDQLSDKSFVPNIGRFAIPVQENT